MTDVIIDVLQTFERVLKVSFLMTWQYKECNILQESPSYVGMILALESNMWSSMLFACAVS